MLSKRPGYDPYDSAGWRVRRGWKQAPTIFWSLPAWRSELETGVSHFLGPARVEFCVEFRVEFRRRRELRSDCSDSCRLRRAKARTQNIAPLSLEGVSQMDSILPERLLALVRPGNDLVLRRIRSLKRCVQACGCKIMTR